MLSMLGAGWWGGDVLCYFVRVANNFVKSDAIKYNASTSDLLLNGLNLKKKKKAINPLILPHSQRIPRNKRFDDKQAKLCLAIKPGDILRLVPES